MQLSEMHLKANVGNLFQYFQSNFTHISVTKPSPKRLRMTCYRPESNTMCEDWMEHGVSTKYLVFIYPASRVTSLPLFLDLAEIIQSRELEGGGGYEYYVHYDGLNRRLDHWVTRDRIAPADSHKDKAESAFQLQQKKHLDNATTGSQGGNGSNKLDTSAIMVLDTNTLGGGGSILDGDRKITRNQKRRHDEINHV